MHGRILSIDALRGLCMLCILGLSNFICAICGLFPGGSDFWLARQMEHVAWHGLAIEDLFFPTFLFLAGVSFPFSLEKQLARGDSRLKIHLKILKRMVILIFCGFLYIGLLRCDFAHFGFGSVLGRIGFAWAMAAIVFVNVRRNSVRAAILLTLLAGYWALNRFLPAPDFPGAALFSPEGSFSCYIDRLVFGRARMQGAVATCEGLLASVSAIGTAMLGMFAGSLLKRMRDEAWPAVRQVMTLVTASVSLLAVGCALSLLMPINKSIWSSSYVLVAAGWSLTALTLFHWVIDLMGRFRDASIVLRVVGMNSILLYMSPLVISYTHATNFFVGGIRTLLPAAVGDFVWWGVYIFLNWLLAWFLHRQRLYFRV